MPRNSWKKPALFLSAASLLGMVLGCSGGTVPRATVKGQVKLGDKVLTGGTVMFVLKENVTGSALIDGNGNYDMRDAPIGDVKVSVNVPKAPFMPKGGMMPKAPTDGTKGGENMMMNTPGMMDPSKIVRIPDKYGNPDTSALTYSVKSGEQTHDITLTP
jgi:hypothetical protein